MIGRIASSDLVKGTSVCPNVNLSHSVKSISVIM